MRGGVDAEGAARHHGPPLLSQAVGKVRGDVITVRCGRSRADNGDRALAGLSQRPRPAYPHAVRWVGVTVNRIADVQTEIDQITQPAWPLVVLGRDDPRAEP